MKSIKIYSLLGLAAGLSLIQAQATINLTPYANPANSPTYVQNAQNSLQPGNSGGAIPDWLANCVAGYNIAINPDLPAPGTFIGAGQNTTTGAGGTSITLQQSYYGGYDYLVLHFGDGPNHNGYFAYYIGGDTGDITLQGNGQGLSWSELYDPKTPSIPEPSTVVAGALLLLPFGVSTLRILRKKNVA